MKIVDLTDPKVKKSSSNLEETIRNLGDLVRNLNKIVKMAFGEKFRGDYYDYTAQTARAYNLEETDRPCIIGRRIEGKTGFEPVGQIGKRFGPQSDGSVIVVIPDYKEQGIKYAKIYERMTGEEATVIIAYNVNVPYDEKFTFIPLDGREITFIDDSDNEIDYPN